MTASYQWEPLRELVKEPRLAELIREHFEEAGTHKDAIPLDIDWATLLDYADKGIFRVVTSRQDGEFVGYQTFWIYPHPLFSGTQRAIQGPWNSHAALAPALRLLREAGIKYVTIHTKNHVSEERPIFEAALSRIGFEPTDTVWQKVL